MHWYVDDRVYFVLPYGHSQARIDEWEDALKLATMLPLSCNDHHGNVYIDCYWEKDTVFPKDKRPFYRAVINKDALRHARGHFTGY